MKKPIEFYRHIILKKTFLNYIFSGYLRCGFLTEIAKENNFTETLSVILDTENNAEGVLKSNRKPAVKINKPATNTINTRVMIGVNTFQTTRRSMHNSIRSQVMIDIVAASTANSFSLPASAIALKNDEPSIPLYLKVDTKIQV